jgi:hypothetical protein
VCQHAALNFTYVSFMNFALNSNMDEEATPPSHYVKGHRKVAWERLEFHLKPLLEQFNLRPYLIVFYSGLWNLKPSLGTRFAPADEREDVGPRAARYGRGLEETVRVMKRLWPAAHHAFRTCPEAAARGGDSLKLVKPRLIGLMNKLVRAAGRRFHVHVFDHHAWIEGMHHLLLPDGFHHGRQLQDLYLRGVLYWLRDHARRDAWRVGYHRAPAASATATPPLLGAAPPA